MIGRQSQKSNKAGDLAEAKEEKRVGCLLAVCSA